MYARIYKRRLEFCNIIGKIVPELKKEIKDKNTISMTTEELVKKLGLPFESRHDELIYWRTRDCIFDKGIVVNSKRDHELTLLMRNRTSKDKLPGPPKEDRK